MTTIKLTKKTVAVAASLAIAATSMIIIAKSDNATAAAIPDAGLPAEVNSLTQGAVKSRPKDIGWGVVTQWDPNDQYITLNTLVTAIEIIGDTVYVGGKFNHVRHGANEPLISQPYLAAFDRHSGAWIDSFRPTLDGAVWALQATPDGKLLVGGNFASFNGVANTAGLAKMDPATGTVASGFNLKLTANNVRTMGRSLTIKGDWAYMAGRFNTAVGGPANTTNAGIGGLLKFKWSDGTPAVNWRPNSDRVVESISASQDSDRVWLAGFFGKVSGQTALGSASLSATTGQRNDPPEMQTVIQNSPINMYNGYEPTWSIGEHNGFVYVGGTQHYFGRHDVNTFAQTAISTQPNGDYQTQAQLYGYVYGGCHCGHENSTLPVGGTWTNTGKIRAFGAWTMDGFVRDSNLRPQLYNWAEGAWALKADPDLGCMWVGGDFTAGPVDLFVSGIAKMCTQGGDITPPSTPTNFAATATPTGVQLTWQASTDNIAGPLTYEILRDEGPIGTSSTTSYADNHIGPGRYFVRSIDAAGNKSATTTVLVWNPAAAPTVLAKTGDTWLYQADGQAPPQNWTTTGSLAAWSQGVSPLGLAKNEATTISTAGVTQYFAKDITVGDQSAMGGVEFKMRVDDGAVLRVNGNPIMTMNMPFGTPTPTTLAASELTSASGNTKTVVVPKSVLVNGTNRLSVELHQATTNNADAIFDLNVVAKPKADSTAPAAPKNFRKTSSTSTAIALAWDANTEADIAGYVLKRNDQPIAYLRSTDLTYSDQQLQPATNYTYKLAAFDMSSNLSANASLTAATTAGGGGGGVSPGDQVLIAAQTPWKWSVSAPPANWNSTADVSAWSGGVDSFGWGPNGQVTALPAGSISQYFVADVQAPADPAFLSAVKQVEFKVSIDDGAVVYLNGTEVWRKNLPFGAPSPTTVALTADTSAPIVQTVRVPVSLLKNGVNRIAIESHQAAANDVDAFAKVTLRTKSTNGDTVAPVFGTGSLGNITATSINLAWTPATDAGGIAYYLVERNGQPYVIRQASATGYADHQLNGHTSYSYQVRAVDLNGNASNPWNVTATTL